jgi:hypothetical protein
MTIDRKSKLYRFAYWFEKHEPDEHVSLCGFFWRVVLLAPAINIMFGVIVSLIVIVSSPLWIPVWVYSRIKGVSFEEAASTQIVRLHRLAERPSAKWMAEKKRAVCPLIRIEG